MSLCEVVQPDPTANSESISESGSVQAMILIQISMHLIEKVEMMLGVPQECCLNGRAGFSEGLLSDRDFAKIVQAVLKKEESGCSEHGRGGVKALRKHMKSAKQLLKEIIIA